MPKHIKDVDDLKNIIHYLDLTDFCRILYSTMGDYTFFSGTHVIFIKIDNILGHETSLNKLKLIEILQNGFCNHIRIKQNCIWKILKFCKLSNKVLKITGFKKKSQG